MEGKEGQKNKTTAADAKPLQMGTSRLLCFVSPLLRLSSLSLHPLPLTQPVFCMPALMPLIEISRQSSIAAWKGCFAPSPACGSLRVCCDGVAGAGVWVSGVGVGVLFFARPRAVCFCHAPSRIRPAPPACLPRLRPHSIQFARSAASSPKKRNATRRAAAITL